MLVVLYNMYPFKENIIVSPWKVTSWLFPVGVCPEIVHAYLAIVNIWDSSDDAALSDD